MLSWWLRGTVFWVSGSAGWPDALRGVSRSRGFFHRQEYFLKFCLFLSFCFLMPSEWEQYIPEFLGDRFLMKPFQLICGDSTRDVLRNGTIKDKNISGQYYRHNRGIFSKFHHPACVNVVNSTLKNLQDWDEKHSSSFKEQLWSLRINEHV